MRACDLQDRFVRLIPWGIGIDPMAPLKGIPVQVAPGGVRDREVGWTSLVPASADASTVSAPFDRTPDRRPAEGEQ
jgi:hypothetical protein